MKQVLFLCTGNYYRSRFAEIYFDYLAEKSGLNWRADSRGLAVELGKNNVGNISPFTLAYCKTLEIPLPAEHRRSQQVTIADLQNADLTVAMYDAEHRPFVADKFPAWLERIEFWRVPDVHETAPDVALPAIQKQVEDLVERLKSETRTK